MLQSDVEALRVEDLKKLQERRLRKTVRYAYHNMPLYRRRLREAGVEVDEVRRSEDLPSLPLTSAEDLRDGNPLSLLAVPVSEVVRFQATSGTMGRPIVVGYTAKDVETWALLMARCLACMGARKGDIVQNAFPYGPSAEGWAFHYGAEALGLALLPTGPAHPRRQLRTLREFGSTVLCCTPTHALHLREEASRDGYRPREDFKVRIGALGGEAWSEGTRGRLEESFGLRAMDIYGLTEMWGPGVAVECSERVGLHLWADLFLPEVVDPVTEEPLEPGELGELVLTPLAREAMPLLRYRTGDLTILQDEECGCGRYHPRIRRVRGRVGEALLVAGTRVLPGEVEDIVLATPGVGDWYEIVLDRDISDHLSLRVEPARSYFESDAFDPADLGHRLEGELRRALALRATVEVRKPGTLPRGEGRTGRLVDLREMGGRP